MEALKENLTVLLQEVEVEIEEEDEETLEIIEEGDQVKNVNKFCKHFESEGTVKKIKELPDEEGYTVGYTCTNAGKNWVEGDLLFKTPDQLEKVEGNRRFNPGAY